MIREMKNIIVLPLYCIIITVLNYWKSSCILYIQYNAVYSYIYSSPVWTPEYVRVFLFLLVNRGDEEDSMLELG